MGNIRKWSHRDKQFLLCKVFLSLVSILFVFLKENVKCDSVLVLPKASKAENKTIFAEHLGVPKWSARPPVVDMPRMWSRVWKHWVAELVVIWGTLDLPLIMEEDGQCFLLTSSLSEAESDIKNWEPNRLVSSSSLRALRMISRWVVCVKNCTSANGSGGGISSQGHAEEGNTNRASIHKGCRCWWWVAADRLSTR